MRTYHLAKTMNRSERRPSLTLVPESGSHTSCNDVRGVLCFVTNGWEVTADMLLAVAEHVTRCAECQPLADELADLVVRGLVS